MGRLLTLLAGRRGAGASPPVAGQALWLDVLRAGTLFQDAARTTQAGVGDPVGSWYDPTAGIGATGAGGVRPTRAADQLTFGGSQYLDISGGLGVGNGQWTAFVVGQINSGNPGLFEFADTDPGAVNTGPGIGVFGGTTFFRQVDGTGDVTSGSYAAGTRRVYAIRRDADSFDAFVNNDTVGTAGLATTPTSAAVTIGRWYTGASIDPLPGDLRAFLVYASALSNGNVAATIAYLAARHGVAL